VGAAIVSRAREILALRGPLHGQRVQYQGRQFEVLVWPQPSFLWLTEMRTPETVTYSLHILCDDDGELFDVYVPDLYFDWEVVGLFRDFCRGRKE
jgi:hypothetical protein